MDINTSKDKWKLTAICIALAVTVTACTGKKESGGSPGIGGLSLL